MSKVSLGILGAVFIAILGLGYAGYTNLGTHTVTIGNEQYATNVQTSTITQIAVKTLTSQTTQTATAANGAAYQLNCGTNIGCNWPYNYDACWGTGVGNGIACDGYLVKQANGCVELAVPTMTVEQPPYNDYTLQGLPSSYPPVGSWVVVKGQLFQGTNSGPTGAACPTNYITVGSIQPTNPPPSP